MPRFAFGVFVWIFAIGNAVVWFALLFGVAYLLAGALAPSGVLPRSTALWIVCLTPLAASVLAIQGSIVNLRVQFLEGRFDLPAIPHEPPPLVNPWYTAGRTAVVVCLIGIPISYAAGRTFFGPMVTARSLGLVLGTFGAVSVLLATLSVSVREFYAFAARLGQPVPSPRRLVAYLGWHLALPWGVVNLILNGVTGWLAFYEHVQQAPHAMPLSLLRADLVGTSVLLTVLIGLAAVPEAECDAALGTVRVPPTLPPMPHLSRRLLFVAGFGTAVWLACTLVLMTSDLDGINVWAAIGLKAVFSGLLAAGCAAMYGRWSLGRARIKHVAWVGQHTHTEDEEGATRS